MDLCMPVSPKHRNPKSFANPPLPVSPVCPRIPRHLLPAPSCPLRCRQARGSVPPGSFWPCVSLSIFIHFGETHHFGNLIPSLKRGWEWPWVQKGPQGTQEAWASLPWESRLLVEGHSLGKEGERRFGNYCWNKKLTQSANHITFLKRKWKMKETWAFLFCVAKCGTDL